MKTLFAFALFFSVSTLLFAQDSTSASKNQTEKLKLISAHTARKSKDGLQTFEKDVTVEIAEKLKLEADLVTFDRESGVIMAYGTKKFTFKGEAVLSKDPKGTCRYKLGDDKLYLE